MLLTFSNFSIYGDNNAFKNLKDKPDQAKQTDDNLAQITNLTNNQLDYEEAGLKGELRSKTVERFLKTMNGTSAGENNNQTKLSFDIFYQIVTYFLYMVMWLLKLYRSFVFIFRTFVTESTIELVVTGKFESKIKAQVHDLCNQREALSEYFKIAIIQ